MPAELNQKLDELARGEFVERSVNVLASVFLGQGRPTPYALSVTG